MTELTDIYICEVNQFMTLGDIIEHYDLGSYFGDDELIYDNLRGGYSDEFYEHLVTVLNRMDLKLYAGWTDWWLVVEVGVDA